MCTCIRIQEALCFFIHLTSYCTTCTLLYHMCTLLVLHIFVHFSLHIRSSALLFTTNPLAQQFVGNLVAMLFYLFL